MIFVDTDILIDALRGYQPAIKFLEQASQADVVACSRVTEVELLTGASSLAHRRPVDRLLRDLRVITPGEGDFWEAVQQYRKLFLKTRIDFFDCLLAATAMRLERTNEDRSVRQRPDRCYNSRKASINRTTGEHHGCRRGE